MSLRERNFWIEQAKEKVLNNAKITDQGIRDIMFIYDDVANNLETEINALFSKFAKDNNITDTMASKLLSDKEHSVWKKSIEEYIKDIGSNATDSKVLLELNTLAMKSRISVKEQLLCNVYQNMINLAEDTTTKASDLLADLLKTNYYQSAFSTQKGLGIGFNISKLSENVIKDILNFPWDTKTFSKSIWEKSDRIAAVAKHELAAGFANGSSVQKMAKNINDIMDKGKYAAERLVRTECSYFSNRGELLSYKEMGISKYRFLGGTEGSINCECGILNGQEFNVDMAEVNVNFPPLHPHCKCTTVAVVVNSIFDKRNDTETLSDNVKFKEWKEKFANKETPFKKVDLLDDEYYALNTYISSESYKLNDKLRRNAKLGKEDKKLIKHLDSALDKMPEYEGTLYRSLSDFEIDDVDEFVKSHVVGADKKFSSYLSTSSNVYDDSFPIQYVIKSKHGKDIRAYNKNEKEILFKRNTSFLITKIDGNTIYMEE